MDGNMTAAAQPLSPADIDVLADASAATCSGPQPPYRFAVQQTSAIGMCLLTAFLLYGHFKAVRHVPLLHLGAGYLYIAAVLLLQLATVRGMFVEDARLLGGAQSTTWLWAFWHLGPALSVLHLGLTEGRRGAPEQTEQEAVRRTAIWLVLALAATAAIALADHEGLPVLDVNGDYGGVVTTGIAAAVELLLLAALVVLWKASGFRSVLHLWVAVLLVALLCDNAITSLAGNRANFGWYVGRLGALVGLSVLAVAYLVEMIQSYADTVVEAEQLAMSNSKLGLDFQESKRHADELEEAGVRKDEFLVMLAHELRNPLAPMSAAAQLLAVRHPDEGLLRETSAMLNRQVAQMSGLVEDLLDAARLSRGIYVLRTVPLKMNEVLAHSVEQVRPLIAEKRHEIDVRFGQDDVFVSGDHGRLVQVITNILVNSAKYTPSGGRILLKLDATPQDVVITVADNGIGMSGDLIDKAFFLFAQGAPTAERSRGGLGVGLALVKQFVELHGGRVWATSAGAGQGTEIFVVLPRLGAHRATSSQ
jgi:signal transduction histidine kinase